MDPSWQPKLPGRFLESWDFWMAEKKGAAEAEPIELKKTQEVSLQGVFYGRVWHGFQWKTCGFCVVQKLSYKIQRIPWRFGDLGMFFGVQILSQERVWMSKVNSFRWLTVIDDWRSCHMYFSWCVVLVRHLLTTLTCIKLITCMLIERK